MSLQDIWKTAEKKANKNVFDFLAVVYQEIKKEQGKEGYFFQQFIERGYQDFENDKKTEPTILSESELIDLFSKYQTLIDGCIDYLVSENLSVDVFYQELWDFIHNSKMFPDEHSSAAGFLLATKHSSMPYFWIPGEIRMDNETYREYTRSLAQQIKKLRFVMSRNYAQKTEKASAALSVLDEAGDEAGKAVLMARLLDMAAERKNQEQDD